jgi:hypothetical protein
MEEILASIRKIIESNEPGAGKSISPSLPPIYAVSADDSHDIHLTVDDDLADAEFDDVPPSASAASEPRFIAANSPGAAREPEPGARTMSLADVAARVRAASERSGTSAGPSRELPPPRELPPGMAERFAEIRREPIAPPPLRNVVPEAPQPAPTLAVVAELAEAIVPMRMAEPMPVEEVLVAETVIAHEPVATETFAPHEIETVQEQEEPRAEERHVPQAQLGEAQQALLSEAAGEQVARSFGALVAAIDGTERRSLDEIAQEMLRPMLQDWLDDNLPTLVERLVREEIERVARGPRR